MGYRVWYSTESWADYIIDNTILSSFGNIEKKYLNVSDASDPTNFHALPDHIKKILYLDSPDIILEKDLEPIFTIEDTKEAGTGHNAYQRFSRIVASIENSVPAFYIYPEAVIIDRDLKKKGKVVGKKSTWDRINPFIFKALKKAMDIYRIPALLYYYPSDFSMYSSNPASSPNKANKGLHHDINIVKYPGCPDSSNVEMKKMFEGINAILKATASSVIDGRKKSILLKPIVDRRDAMEDRYHSKTASKKEWSPMTATLKVPTWKLINYLSNFHTTKYNVGELLKSRDETIIYKVNAKFRGDPYPGALAAVDYIAAREGKSFEERYYNLVLAWGKVIETDVSLDIDGSSSASIDDFCNQVAKSESNSNILHKPYSDLKNQEISRYYMQVRYGSMFSKVKHIRVYSYFADAILFCDGALWRDG